MNSQLNKEKFLIAIRVRPTLSDDHKIYKQAEMDEIL